MSVIVDLSKEQIKNLILNAAETAVKNGEFEGAELPDFTIEIPANRDHGDYAVNAAMVWARAFRKAPRQIAEVLVKNINTENTYIKG